MDQELIRQICDSSVSEYLITNEIGVWETGYVCPDAYEWFEGDVDYTQLGREGEITVERTDKTSNSGYKQTQSGKVEWTRNITFKPKLGAPFTQKLMDIIIRNGVEKWNGDLIRKYSDGGFALRTTIKSRDGKVIWTETCYNVKAGKFLDAFGSDFDDAELEQELEFAIEHDPYYDLTGVISKFFGMPLAVRDPKIIYDGINNTATSLQLDNAQLINGDVSFDDKAIITITRENGATQTQEVVSGSDVLFESDFSNAGEKIVITFKYKINEATTYAINNIDYVIV